MTLRSVLTSRSVGYVTPKHGDAVVAIVVVFVIVIYNYAWGTDIVGKTFHW